MLTSHVLFGELHCSVCSINPQYSANLCLSHFFFFFNAVTLFKNDKILFLLLVFHNCCILARIHNGNEIMNSTALYFNSLQMRLIFAKSGYGNPWLCSFVLIKHKRRGEREKHWHIVSVIKD